MLQSKKTIKNQRHSAKLTPWIWRTSITLFLPWEHWTSPRAGAADRTRAPTRILQIGRARQRIPLTELVASIQFPARSAALRESFHRSGVRSQIAAPTP